MKTQQNITLLCYLDHATELQNASDPSHNGSNETGSINFLNDLFRVIGYTGTGTGTGTGTQGAVHVNEDDKAGTGTSNSGVRFALLDTHLPLDVCGQTKAVKSNMT